MQRARQSQSLDLASTQALPNTALSLAASRDPAVLSKPPLESKRRQSSHPAEVREILKDKDKDQDQDKAKAKAKNATGTGTGTLEEASSYIEFHKNAARFYGLQPPPTK